MDVLRGITASALLLLILLVTGLMVLSRVSASDEMTSGLAGVSSATVVLSEVMWMGSDLSTADEWVEIACIGSGTADLTGWQLTSLNSKGEEVTIVAFSTGALLSAGDVRVISNYPAASSRLLEEPWMTSTAMTLPNTKLLLRLRDAAGVIHDEVDDGVGVPFAGSNPSGGGPKASMERIDLSAPGTLKENWRTATDSIGFKPGAPIFGTPGFLPEMSSSSSLPSSSSSSFISSSFSESSAFSESGSSLSSASSSSEASSSSSSGSSLSLSFSSEYSSQTSSTSTTSRTYVLITEVLANPRGSDDTEWIEVANLGTGSVSIAGLQLSAEKSTRVFVIPSVRAETGAFPPRASTEFVLLPGEHVSFRKTVTGIPLVNTGDTVRLSSGSIVVDSLDYPETGEGVSYGRDRDDPLLLHPFCLPTEGAPNVPLTLDPHIVVQDDDVAFTASGGVIGQGHLTLNLLADVSSGSLATARCHWDYGDGYVSESCNPPSHALNSVGDLAISLTVSTLCGESISRALPVTIEAVSRSGGGGGTAAFSAGEAYQCIPTFFGSGVILSEVFPDPFGNEEEGEWVELENTTDEVFSLCGWSLDDEKEGSDPYALDHERIFPRSFLLLPRTQTNIALNNDGDAVRLFGPGGHLVEELAYTDILQGESLARRGDGAWVSTPYPTPGEANKFRTAERRYPTSAVIVSAALPNPEGRDDGKEWMEIFNRGGEEASLDGWSLDDGEGRGKPFLLTGSLLPMESKRFSVQQTGLTLVNTFGSARLLDPDGYITSLVGWTEAKEGMIYRPPHLVGEPVRARVLSVIDGDTFTITLDDLPDLSRVPSPLKRRWVALRDAGDTALRVRLIGIDAPELDDPRQEVQRFAVESKEFLRALVEGQFVTLIFEGEYFDRYGRLLAYAEKDGSSIEEELLRRGLVTSSTWSFAYVNEYRALGAEARTAKLGLWAKSSVAEVMMGSGTLLAGMEPDILIATGSVKVEPSCESSGTGVVLSEVYPSPPSGGSGDVLDGEWIELFNPTDHVVSLGDWTLDDLPDGGSRPWAFPCDFILGPRERKVVLSQETGLRLNNDGDEVWLTSLDGTPVDHVTYPRISTGLSFSLVATGTGSVWCLSDPTPLEPNTCRTEEASSRSSVHVRRSPSGFLHTRYVMENTAVESGPMRWVAALGTGFTLIGEEVKSFGGGRGHWPFLEWGIALALAVVSSVALWSSPQKRGEDQRRMNKERVINP